MKTEEKVQKLILGYDLSSLGINWTLPEPIKDLKLSQDVLDKYSPSFLERVCHLAWLSCFENFKINYPDGTEEEFRANFLSKPAGFAVYQKAVQNLQSKIEKTVLLETLKEFQRVRFLNLTRVDLRQVREK